MERLSSITIDQYYLGNKKFGGWYNKDRLPSIKNKFYIINMEDAGGRGTHWVMVYNCNPTTCIYFDSFGIHPPIDILRFMKGSNKECVMSDVEIQNMKSEACGYYCLMVIDKLENGESYVDILMDTFSFDTINNELIVTANSGGSVSSIRRKLKSINPINKIKKTIKKTIKGEFQLRDRIEGFVEGPRSDAPPSIRNFLKLKGENDIIAITVCRTPVLKFVDTALNIVSLGKWANAKQRLDYDDMYHLFLFLTYTNGVTYRIEKNEVVTVTKTSKKEGECINVPMIGRSIKTNDFFNNAIKENPLTFWLYASKINNCQVFINNILRYNLLNTPELEEFVMQDAVALFEKLPGYVEKIANIATDLGARANILLEGRGVNGLPLLNRVYWVYKNN